MAKAREIYRCAKSGATFEVLTPGTEVECDGKPLELLVENTTDAAKEKHVPVIEKIEGGYKVTVGGVEHPMLENHYIQWIELQAGADIMRHELKPGEKPVAVFKTDAEHVTAREYCNLHGLWKSEL